MIHLDTHVLVWLFGQQFDRVPAAVRRRIESEPVAISPMVTLELRYLFEVKKVSGPPQDVLDDLGTSIELAISDAPFPRVVAAALDLDWTRDVFDRLICGQAIADDAALITADRRIRDHFSQAAWD
ncbi:MAG: type II toxin-antitoxin system VapC family toxin [Acidimicrobiales bacterium]